MSNGLQAGFLSVIAQIGQGHPREFIKALILPTCCGGSFSCAVVTEFCTPENSCCLIQRARVLIPEWQSGSILNRRDGDKKCLKWFCPIRVARNGGERLRSPWRYMRRGNNSTTRAEPIGPDIAEASETIQGGGALADEARGPERIPGQRQYKTRTERPAAVKMISGEYLRGKLSG